MKLHQCPSMSLGAPVLQPSQGRAHGKGGSTDSPSTAFSPPFSFRNLVALFSQKNSALVYALKELPDKARKRQGREMLEDFLLQEWACVRVVPHPRSCISVGRCFSASLEC